MISKKIIPSTRFPKGANASLSFSSVVNLESPALQAKIKVVNHHNKEIFKKTQAEYLLSEMNDILISYITNAFNSEQR